MRIIDIIRRDTEKLKRELRQVQDQRAKIRGMASQLSVGMPVFTGNATSIKELVEKLRIQTAYREQLALKARVAHAEAEMEAESKRLEQQIAEMEQKLQEPLSLNLTAPTPGQVVVRGRTLDIRWDSSGPLGERLRIGLMKRGIHLRHISSGAPTNDGTFAWPVSPNLPLADDYQISIQDTTSGLSAVTDRFQVQ